MAPSLSSIFIGAMAHVLVVEPGLECGPVWTQRRMGAGARACSKELTGRKGSFGVLNICQGGWEHHENSQPLDHTLSSLDCVRYAGMYTQGDLCLLHGCNTLLRAANWRSASSNRNFLFFVEKFALDLSLNITTFQSSTLQKKKIQRRKIQGIGLVHKYRMF